MQAIAESRPDILIVDISLNGPDGLELLKSIRASDPDLPVLILSMHDEAIYAERALRAGANGYIMKQEATEKVLVAVRRILNGEIYLSDRMANKHAAPIHRRRAHRMIQSRIASLSDRELEVFRLIGEGHGTRRDRRRTAPQRKNRGNLPGAYQGEAVSAQRPRIDAACHPMEDQRIESPTRSAILVAIAFRSGKPRSRSGAKVCRENRAGPAC